MDPAFSITWGTNNKPVASQILAETISNLPDISGQLILGYPLIVTAEGRYPINALWVSPAIGIVIFDLIEGNDPGNYSFRQDDIANKLEARLKPQNRLMNRRELLIPIHTISFAPGIKEVEQYHIDQYPLTNRDSIIDAIKTLKWATPNNEVYEIALSTIQNITTIRSARNKRVVEKADSRGAKLKRLEDSIATLDNLQNKAVLETVDGVQRIRGLAGSGKTIVLALKAAYLHAQNPNWRIAVTFNTRALKGQFKRLINNFTLEQTGEEPDWGNLRILNAWGASGSEERSGIYHEFCKINSLDYYDFRSAQIVFGRGHEFAGACNAALLSIKKINPLYDAILIDEAQDFPPEFLRLCYDILDDNKRLVYAYDELQNLSGESLPLPEEIFGKNKNGKPNVEFHQNEVGQPQQDIILEKCYRNSRPVLVTAHALGFGIYRIPPKNKTTGLVQIFESSHLWNDIGYQTKEGSLEEGKKVVLCRTEKTSPRFLEDHSSIDDLVQFVAFKNDEDQVEWLVNQIVKNLKEEELRHDDIVVINPDPLTTRERVGPVRRRLYELGIQSHLAGVDTDPDIFFKTDTPSITFTGIFRAKGNEAGMIYIINAQDCHSSDFNLATIRNRLFTAITRSKAWVRVLGVGEDMKKIVDEYNKLKQMNFELHFTYPTTLEQQQLRIVHRDVTVEEKKRVESRNRNLNDVVQDLETGKLFLEDLDEDMLVRLRNIFNK